MDEFRYIRVSVSDSLFREDYPVPALSGIITFVLKLL